jgi:exodeoxyribonuclease VIII
MHDVMLDLETLGVSPGCAVVSIGAVAFDEFGVDATGFYAAIDVPEWNVEGLTPYGLRKEIGTIDWWRKQSEEARSVFCGGGDMMLALGLFATYLRDIESDTGQAPRVWGNGADFDLPILLAAAKAAGMNEKSLWGGFNGRCYRTVKNGFKSVKMVRSGTHHNALDDARSQAEHLVAICQTRGWTLA